MLVGYDCHGIMVSPLALKVNHLRIIQWRTDPDRKAEIIFKKANKYSGKINHTSSERKGTSWSPAQRCQCNLSYSTIKSQDFSDKYINNRARDGTAEISQVISEPFISSNRTLREKHLQVLLRITAFQCKAKHKIIYTTAFSQQGLAIIYTILNVFNEQ